MKNKIIVRLGLLPLTFLFFLFAIVACKGPTVTTTPTTTAPLPPPDTRVTSAPSAQLAAQAFMDNWKKLDYPAMYAQLTAEAQGKITPEKFAEKYGNLMNEATVTDLEYAISSAPTKPDTTEIIFHVTLHTAIFGDIQRDGQLNLRLEQAIGK